MRGVIPDYHHSYIFFLFVILTLFPNVFPTSTLSSSETLTISSNRTIVSPGDVFELGFFKPTTSSRYWYIGIWYKTVSARTYVWIANRDNPLLNSIGAFKISYNNLVLLDESNNLVWSTNLKSASISPMLAELLDNGNFVLKDSKSKDPSQFLWQSFDFPVDTLLPEMKLGRNLKTGHDKFLTSWKSPTDPSSGDYSFKLETRGLQEFYLYTNDVYIYRTGPWDGIRFNGIPSMQRWSYTVSNFIQNRDEVSYMYKVTNQNIRSRFTLTSSGNLKMITRTNTVPVRNMFWLVPTEQCDLFSRCSSYSYCDKNTSPVCNCINGFRPVNMSKWSLGDTSHGCMRMSPLNCQGDGFVLMKNMKLPETSKVVVDYGIGLKECEGRCLKDCNCTGFANTDIRNGGLGCVIWTGELMDMRNFVDGGQDLYYVKLGASSLVSTIIH